jgi:hypothetical protein
MIQFPDPNLKDMYVEGIHSGRADELRLLEKKILSVIDTAKIGDLSVWIKLQQEIALIFHEERQKLNQPINA